jgi:hypothetical protein
MSAPLDGVTIRSACLRPASAWQKPSSVEIREVIRRAGMTGAEVAAFLGLSDKSPGRQVRRWISEETTIPYSAWALLCAAAGLGQIWDSPGER